jgi:hypothetical protein
MTKTQLQPQMAIEESREAILIDAGLEKPMFSARKLGICWNTGEEKTCPSCYLSKGCKAK